MGSGGDGIALSRILEGARQFQQEVNDLGAGSPQQIAGYWKGVYPVEWDLPGLGIHLRVSFDRHTRGRCSTCNKRRVLYSVGLGEFQRGPKLCAKCSGIR